MTEHHGRVNETVENHEEHHIVSAQYDLDWVFPGANTLLALLIAFGKMSIVVLWFMHVKYSSKLIWLTAIAGFFWLAIMFAFTMQDYLTRSAGVFTR